MRLPTQPKTVKPKVNTIANTIQNRFMLVPSLFRGTPGSASSIPFLQCRNPIGPLQASHELIRMPSSSPPLASRKPPGMRRNSRIRVTYIRHSSPHHPLGHNEMIVIIVRTLPDPQRGLSSLLTALLLIGLHHVLQCVIESLCAEQLEQLVATALPDVFHHLRHHQAYPLFLQYREKRP